MRRVVIVLVILGVAAGGWAANRYLHSGENLQIKTTQLVRGPLRMTVETTGTVSPLVSVSVGCEVSGTVGELNADFNTIVKKDQILARLRPELFEADLAQSQANVLSARAQATAAEVSVATATRQYEKVKRLAERKAANAEEVAVAKEALDAAQARLAAAQAAVKQAEAVRDLAQTKLDRSVIYAPMDGIVLSRLVDVGTTVAAALTSPVLFIMAPDLDRMQVHANVSESDIGRVRKGQSAAFTVDAYPQRHFSGEVVQVRNNPTTIQGVVSYVVVIEVDNRARLLKPGMTANVVIEVANRSDVLKVANAALRFKPPITPEQFTALTADLKWPGADDGPAASPAPEVTEDGSALASVLPRVQSVLWTYDGRNWRPVPVVLGITDNRETEVLSGPGADFSCVISAQNVGGSYSFSKALQQSTPGNRSL
jgi:HlyD family secretion protein